ncbi:hypothetical protein ABH892_002219 [Paenibacillus sp. RC254]
MRKSEMRQLPDFYGIRFRERVYMLEYKKAILLRKKEQI